MSIFKKLPVLGMLALAAACGGGDEGGQTSDTGAASGTETAAPAPAPAGTGTAAPAGQGTVHDVKMVTTQGGASGQFEPANLTVKKGDVIRFTTDGGAAHNASFPAAENAGAANLPPATQYLTTAGQTVDWQITMDPGTYTYQCDPHAATGMKGTITVQ